MQAALALPRVKVRYRHATRYREKTIDTRRYHVMCMNNEDARLIDNPMTNPISILLTESSMRYGDHVDALSSHQNSTTSLDGDAVHSISSSCASRATRSSSPSAIHAAAPLPGETLYLR